jgi:hypothetical protein
MRSGDPYQAIGDSLQADVMRFMAIIAFCLIAILALVRSVEPPVTPAALTPAPRPAPAAAQGRAESTTHARSVVPQELVSPPEVVGLPEVVAQPEVVALPEVVAQPEVVALPDMTTPTQAETPPEVMTPPEAPAPRPEPVAAQPPVEPPASPEPGLSLRFASDQDFLRLVNRGEIRVFAFNDDEVLSLQDDFSFRPAHTPGPIHELLPETIPELMAGALARADGGGGYRWGIAMPESMSRQIRIYLERDATGELVIDRFGKVRHHGA